MRRRGKRSPGGGVRIFSSTSPWPGSASDLPLSLLPLPLQRDMKAFFGTYTKACAEADALLFKTGEEARSTRRASARPSASCCRTTCTSTGARWTPWSRCCVSTRAAAGHTSARSKGRTSSRFTGGRASSHIWFIRTSRRPPPGAAASRQAEPADPADRRATTTPRARTRRSCTARRRSCCLDDPLHAKFARLTAKKKSMACWTTRAGSARGMDGQGDWPSGVHPQGPSAGAAQKIGRSEKRLEA